MTRASEAQGCPGGGRASLAIPAPAAAAQVEGAVTNPDGDGDDYSDVESMPDMAAGSETESEADDDGGDGFDGIQPAKPTFSLERLMEEKPELVRVAPFDEPCLPRARESSRSKRKASPSGVGEGVGNPANREALIPNEAWEKVQFFSPLLTSSRAVAAPRAAPRRLDNSMG